MPRTRMPAVLVVDDEPSLRHLLAAGLPRYGFAVHTACGGHEALELFRSHPGGFAAVLLDVCMPRLDGPATLTALRAIAPAVRCCFITGHSGRSGTDDLLALGAARVVEKPFRLDDLAATLRAVLA
jgi:DNA-binding response OmpR family regulator